MTNSVSGIKPTDAIGFIGTQIFGAFATTYVRKWLWVPSRKDYAFSKASKKLIISSSLL